MSATIERRRFSVAEFARLAEVGVFGPDERLELVEGEVVQMSPIGAAWRDRGLRAVAGARPAGCGVGGMMGDVAGNGRLPMRDARLREVDPPRTHDVSYLLERLSGATPVPPELGPLCAQLADLGVAPRHPGWDPIALEIDARDAVEAARGALHLLESLVMPGQAPPAGDGAAGQ